MKPLAASHLDSNYFVFTNFHSSFFICFIMFHASMSAFSVGESGLKSSQDSNRSMFFVFLHPKLQKSQEFLARRLFVCSKQQTLRIVVAERLLEGENRWDRIGQLRNQGLRARHSPDGAAVHLYRV